MSDVLISALGATIRLDLDDTMQPAHAAELRQLWSRSFLPTGTPADAVLTVGLGAGSTARVSAGTLDLLWERVSQQVTLAAIRARRPELLMLHACGLVDPGSGRAAALIAPSGIGKTTAAAELGTTWGYLSDETVGITAAHEVVGHPKPLSVKPGAARPPGQVSADALGLAVPPLGVSIAALVMLDRDDHGGQPTARRLDLTSALDTLVPQISYLPHLPDGLLRLARLIAHCGGVWKVSYREAGDLAAVVESIVRQAAPESCTWSPLPPMSEEPAPSQTAVRRHRSTTSITDGRSTVVLANETVHQLGGLGPALWGAAGQWIEPESLARRLVDVAGPPPVGDADSLARTMVDDLVARGLLEKESSSRSRKAAAQAQPLR